MNKASREIFDMVKQMQKMFEMMSTDSAVRYAEKSEEKDRIQFGDYKNFAAHISGLAERLPSKLSESEREAASIAKGESK